MNKLAMKEEKQLISRSELAVLRCLHEKQDPNAPLATAVEASEIGQISMSTGIRDSNEVLRALYTLEGKSLVRPEPAGDFTSTQWTITDVGSRALNVLQAH